jgi:hypothetical protein
VRETNTVVLPGTGVRGTWTTSATVVPTGSFGWEFSAGAELAAVTGETELGFGRNLCRAVNTRAPVNDATVYPDYWFLISADGSYGRVMTDPAADGDELRIMHALEPITGEPDLPVVPVPEWARDW